MIELQHVSCETEDGKVILRDISLTLDDRLTAITGPNGSGKSTLVKVIAGIMPATSGKVLLDGEDITHLSVTERARRGVSFAFQQPVRFKGIAVSDLVEIAAGRKLAKSEVCSYLSEVGLCANDYVGREVNASLSGGELKRIEIATALARNTKLTLFDEPEAGIDLWSFQNLIKVFEKMQRDRDGQIVVISHQERILSVADRIVLLTAGEVTAIGGKDEIFPLLMKNTAPCGYRTEV